MMVVSQEPVSLLIDATGTLNEIKALVIHIKFTQHSITHQFRYRLVKLEPRSDALTQFTVITKAFGDDGITSLL